MLKQLVIVNIILLCHYVSLAATSSAQSIGSRQAMDAVSAIREVGGDAQFIEENGEVHIKSVSCYDIKNGENIINLIPFDDELESFTFVRSTISDEVFRKVRLSKTLKLLNLDNTQVGDSILLKLKDCVFLQTLSLGGTKITDSGLKNIEKLNRLRILKLDNTSITDEGLKVLSRFRNLNVIMLNHTKITDNGIYHLMTLRDLQSLSLGRTGVTDQGLLHLKGNVSLRILGLQYTRTKGLFVRDNYFPNLRALFLCGTDLNEDNFLRLENQRLLKYVEVSETAITNDAITALKKKFLKNGTVLEVAHD